MENTITLNLGDLPLSRDDDDQLRRFIRTQEDQRSEHPRFPLHESRKFLKLFAERRAKVALAIGEAVLYRIEHPTPPTLQ